MKNETPFEVSEFTIPVSEKIGKVSAIMCRPTHCSAMLTLAHGAGSDMRNEFLDRLARTFAGHDIGILRFNFPYKEQGRKMPDRPPVATETVSCVLDFVHTLDPSIPVFGSGKSFGGRMTSLSLSTSAPAFVKGVIFFGFPLHPPGKPGMERAAHLISVPVPMLFLQGTKDTLAEINLMEQVCSTLPLSTLVKLEGHDHGFNRGKQSVVDVLVQRSAHWIKDVLSFHSGYPAGQLSGPAPN